MHGPTLAKELNIRKVIIPVAAPVFSAWGMLMSDIRHDFIQTKILSFQNASMDELNAMWKSQIDEAHKILASEGLKEDQAIFTFIADMRYADRNIRYRYRLRLIHGKRKIVLKS